MTLLCSGCSTTTKSTLLGVGAGAVTGFASGAYFSQKDRNKNAMIGSLIFGLVGGALGYYSNQELEKRDQKIRRETLFNLENFGVSGDFELRDKTFTNLKQGELFYEK